MQRIPTPPPLDPSLLDEFDDMVLEASQGNVHAVQAIAIALGPPLYEAARELVDPDDSAAELLAEFLDALLLGNAGRFRPEHERALHWMERTLCRFARRRRWRRRAPPSSSENPTDDD